MPRVPGENCSISTPLVLADSLEAGSKIVSMGPPDTVAIGEVMRQHGLIPVP